MAPIRRYLRITKHSVLEVRIYLAVRPLVLPKLREENERASGRSRGKAKKKGVKDVVVEDDFEVSIFLTEHSTRHSVLTKQKLFKNKPRIQSNSSNLTGWLAGTSEQPVVINEAPTEPIVIREEEDDEQVSLTDIPEANGSENEATMATGDQDQKKKLSLNTSYEGFSIYGSILCLVVKRRGIRYQAGHSNAPASSRQMLENWVSTQAAAEQVDDDEDIG
ncbi:hypothetical protein N0V90_013407 [Kalmusia sp. IMI 367209]|nr:hypothetical protein N0V90_013407 [Kalmusia sp. IMI 367209]